MAIQGKINYLFVIISLTIFYACIGQAEEFSFTVFPMNQEPSWQGDKTIISKYEMDTEQVNFASEILRETAGFVMSGSGDNGRQKRFSMRGALGGENQVLIDGIPVNNPAASGGAFDFADLMIDDMESIEVDPGLPNVVDGSDAIGGSVKLHTKTGRGPNKTTARLEGGSFKTGKAAASTSGTLDDLSYAITSSGFRSGNGKFKNRIHHNTQSDDYETGTISSKIGYAITPGKEIEGSLRWTESELDFDELKFSPEFSAFLPEKSGNQAERRHQLFSLKYEGEHQDGLIKPSLQISNSNTRINSHTKNSRTRVLGNSSLIKQVTPINWNDSHKTSIGGELGRDKADDTYAGKHDRKHYALFAQHEASLWQGGESLAGLRYNHYESTGRMLNYKLGLAQSFHATRIRSSIGTGFKAPIITDQFTSSPWAISNPSLKPEKSLTYDAGIDQKLFNNRMIIALTGFFNRINQVFTSAITDDFKFQRINGGRRNARGIEGKLSISPTHYVEISNNLTGTWAQDNGPSGKKRSPHIPKWVNSTKIIVTPLEDLTIFASNTFTSAQIDAVSRERLHSFNLVNIGTGYRLTPNLELTLRAENITDKRYEETFGYGVRGRAFYIGARAEF